MIRRIYQHAVERGWFKEGDVVLDLFGGVALGALDAMYQGLHWISVELEGKFVDLGQQNIDLWNSRYSALPRWGTAVIIQGDSRDLVDVLDRALTRGVVASPPFVHSLESRGDGIDWEKACKRGYRSAGRGAIADGYSTNPANLGNMREGDFGGVVSSPPYSPHGVGHDAGHPRLDDIEDERRAREGCSRRQAYGTTPGQLAAMPEGLVSSPPYEGSIHDPGTMENKAERLRMAGHNPNRWLGQRRCQQIRNDGYGETNGQLGVEQGDTFWSAARQIVEQCYQVLAPGAVAIWVVKAFVRNKEIVDFPGQWRAMCEACGFETIEVIRAWLVEDRGAQYCLNGDLEERQVKRCSFFRRLYEGKYPENSIDYEVVLCMRKAA